MEGPGPTEEVGRVFRGIPTNVLLSMLLTNWAGELIWDSPHTAAIVVVGHPAMKDSGSVFMNFIPFPAIIFKVHYSSVVLFMIEGEYSEEFSVDLSDQ